MKPFREWKLLDKILLISGSTTLLLFIGYIIGTHRAPREFYLPSGYNGWVMIRYEKSGGQKCLTDEGTRRIVVGKNGIADVQEEYEGGWGKEAYFYWDGLVATEIPRDVATAEMHKTFIHGVKTGYPDHTETYRLIAPDSDTTLWDGTEISRGSTEKLDVRAGRKTVEWFYISSEPLPYGNPIPPRDTTRLTW